MSDPADNQPPTSSLVDPQTDADRIRLKRLAKLQAQGGQSASASTSTTPSAGPSTPAPAAPTPTPRTQQPTPQSSKPATPAAPSPGPSLKKPAVEPAPATPPPLKKNPATPAGPTPLDVPTWTHETIGQVLGVTLQREVAEKSNYEIVWLKPLADELVAEGVSQPLLLTEDLADRVFIARLEIDPESMSDDLEFLPVLASLPRTTLFEYLVNSWKRINAAQTALNKRKHPPVETQQATAVLDKLRDLVISYAGLTLQDPHMFPQPHGVDESELGAPELVKPLLALSALSGPLSSSTSAALLSPAEVVPFLNDLSARFHPSDELADVLGPVFRRLLTDPSLADPAGLVAPDAGWRRILAGLEALIGVKGGADVLTSLPEWIPEGAGAATLETTALLGPLLRLGVVERDWPYIAKTYFSEVEKRTQADVDASFASLRGTLKSLQGALFGIFNALVRAGAGPRKRVLQFFGAVIRLNRKRSGMQVDPATVASDSFMLNAQAILLRFAEPFMDSRYSKLDRVDGLYFARTDLIDLGDETRVNATAQEAADWMQEAKAQAAGGPAPNFISDVFFLAVAAGHYGLQQTIARYEDSLKHYDELHNHIRQIEADNSWMGTPWQARTEAALQMAKTKRSEVGAAQFAFRTALEDPEFVFRSLAFANFVSTWILRTVDPRGQHPEPVLELPLPKEVPLAFRALPEYMFEDVVETLLFYARYTPGSLALGGKNEIVAFALTFLTSTWYIKNPFLKSKLIEILYAGSKGRGENRDRGPLASVLHENPLAQKHLMPALMHFYIEVEQTGASSQFYDKFSSRTLMAYLFKSIWNSSVHKEALNIEAKKIDRFVRFVNLMISDVTYLMDESLNDMTQIHAIQSEMADEAAWAAKPQDYRREKEKTLRQLERMASGYCDLSRSTVELLQTFTAETREPFMLPEIVDKLAAMLDYNLDALVGPKCSELKVKNPDKYRFNPRNLLKEFLSIFINLGHEEAFIRAVAQDGRSYRKELFQKAMGVCNRVGLKSPQEIEEIGKFVERVEEMKLTIEAEEDLGEIPEEFTDPLMATLMRDPVILPSSRAIVDRATIRGYLLSEIRDPFNRQPLTIDQVIPADDLKAKIDAWVAERRAAKMDTS